MTENHNYSTPAQGTTDWHTPLNQNFDALDADVEIRDSDTNRSDYEPKKGAKYLATDTGERYLGDGTQWKHLPYPSDGSSSSVGSFSGSRPAVSTGAISISVDSSGGGDYKSIQAAVDNELPWLIRHKVKFNVSSGTYDEHVVVPPYIANWAEKPENGGERVPIQFDGNQSSPSNCKLSSITFSGGIGTCQVRGFEFTSNTGAGGVDDEGAHVASYHTDKVGLVNCKSGGNAKRFIIAYNGRVATRQSIDAGNGLLTEFVKVKNMGNFQCGGGSSISGNVTGFAYVVDDGTINFNNAGDSSLTGNNGLVRQYNGYGNDGGWAFDMGNGRMWLPGDARGFVLRDQSTGNETEIFVSNGSLKTNTL